MRPMKPVSLFLLAPAFAAPEMILASAPPLGGGRAIFLCRCRHGSTRWGRARAWTPVKRV